MPRNLAPRRRVWSSRRVPPSYAHNRGVAARPQRRKRNVTSWNGLSSRSIDGPSLAVPSGRGRSRRSVAYTDPTCAAAVTVARARRLVKPDHQVAAAVLGQLDGLYHGGGVADRDEWRHWVVAGHVPQRQGRHMLRTTVRPVRRVVGDRHAVAGTRRPARSKASVELRLPSRVSPPTVSGAGEQAGPTAGSDHSMPEGCYCSPIRGGGCGVAEDAGFEPARACTQHAFQACAIGL